MIKADFGKVTIDGRKSQIMAELSTIIYSCKINGFLTDEEINTCVQDALNITPEELEKFSNELIDKLKSIIGILEG